MIITFLLNSITSLEHFIFNLLPNIPEMPSSISDSIDGLLDMIFSNASIIGFFVSLPLIKILIPLIIVITNFEYIYRVVKWVIEKIPFLNIK